MLAAEDARVDGPGALVPFLEGLAHRDAEAQRAAVRALGRLERSALAPQIALGFRSSDVAVRVATARALAQSARRAGAADARRELIARLHVERVPAVRGVIAESIGRLTYTSTEGVAAAERDILAGMVGREPAASSGLLLPLTRGLESLTRRHAHLGQITEASLAFLRRAARFGRNAEASERDDVEPREPGRQVRRLAVAALATSARLDSVLVDALDDPDDQVRRLAYRAVIGALVDPVPVIRRGLADGAWLVRFEALASANRRRSEVPCALVRPVLDDPVAHVALAAIDAVAALCEGDPETAGRLAGWTAPPPATSPVETADVAAAPVPPSWHRRARAFTSLAALDPGTARDRLAAFAGDEVWQVRVAAVRAAATLGDGETLEHLATDPVDNVREAALRPLLDLRGAGALPSLLAALGRDDPQLVLTAARLIEPLSADPRLADGLAAALDRVTALKRETSRDIRLALVDALKQHAGPARTEWLRPYLDDFDPLVAARAADALSAWTGERPPPRSQPLPRSPLPTAADLRRMAVVRVTLHMTSGARVELRLLPDAAPLNAFRFLRLAETGYYDGLTFHRVVPGFVVQGGSPGANEYWGDGPFSRDEVGVSNERGTVGLSTRGRDTGDAQFYINLVDNVRLDDDYTVFAEVVSGMEHVDGFLEGERIERVEVTDADPAAAP
jgi:cyclophilin family peptidyl-prolyl cis-trans isomerase/HEAT repeat protein